MVSFFKSLVSYNLNLTDEVPTEQEQPILTIEESIREFRSALQAAPGLSVSADDAYLLRFLRAKSFRIPDAVKLYKGTDAWKEKNASILNIPFSRCVSLYNTGAVTVFKQKNQEGCTIVHFQADKWDPTKHGLHDFIKLVFGLIEETQLIDENCINGVMAIINMDGLQLSKALEMIPHFSVKNVKTLLGFATGGSPVKVKGFHGISSPFICYTTYMGLKYLIKRKMRDRIALHYEGNTAIHKYCNKETLPEFLGGTLPNDDIEDTELIKSYFLKNNVIYNPNDRNIH